MNDPMASFGIILPYIFVVGLYNFILNHYYNNRKSQQNSLLIYFSSAQKQILYEL